MKGWRVHFPSARPMAAEHLEPGPGLGPGLGPGRRCAECDLCPSRSMHLSLFSLFFTPTLPHLLIRSFLQYRPLPLLDLRQPSRPLPSSLTLCLSCLPRTSSSIAPHPGPVCPFHLPISAILVFGTFIFPCLSIFCVSLTLLSSSLPLLSSGGGAD